VTIQTRAIFLAAVLACGIISTALGDPAMDKVLKDLAPTGKLRAAINLGVA